MSNYNRSLNRRNRPLSDYDLFVPDHGKRRRDLVEQNENQRFNPIVQAEKYREIKTVLLRDLPNANKANVLAALNQQPANLGIGVDLIVKVKFHCFFPKEFHTPGCHIRPVFFVNDFERPVLIQHHIEQTKTVCSNGDVMYMVTVEADLPYNLHEEIKIYYTYRLETYENSHNDYKIESLLTDHDQIRFFYPLSRLLTSKNSKTITVPNQVLDEIDGLLLFASVTNSEYLKRVKSNLVERLLPIDLLNSENVLTDKQHFKGLIKFYVTCYKCLGKNDKDYADLFDTFLSQVFDRILRQMRVNQMNDSMYLCVLAIFYLSSRFKLSKNSDRMREIFTLHNINRSNYFMSLNDYFKFDQDDERLENDLKEFLETCNFDVGFNALVVLYQLNENRLEENLLNMRNENILRLVNKNKTNDLVQIIASYSLHFENMIQNDPIIGALLLNYFQPNDVELEQLFKSDSIPFECYIYFIGFKILNDKYDEFERRFFSPNIQHQFRLITRQFQTNNQEFQNNKSQELIKIYNSCSSLLNLVLTLYTKEYETIINLIDLISNVRVSLTSSNNDPDSNFIMRDYESLIETSLSRLFRSEFNQSLLISYGIEKISQEDFEERHELIRIYRNFSDYYHNPYNYKPPKFRKEKFESVQEVKSFINYFGLQNQHEILLKLLQLKVVDEKVFKVFRDHINSKLSNKSLTECLHFLVRFNFSKLSEYQKNFQELTVDLISKHLVASNDEHEIEILCQTLQSTSYQTYLDHFVGLIVNNIWPKEHGLLEFGVQKRFFLVFLNIYVNNKTKGLSNPFNLPQVSERFSHLIDEYKTLINSLISSDVSLYSIELISSNMERVILLNRLMVQYFQVNFSLSIQTFDLFKFLVDVRLKEKKQFESYRDNLQKFVKFASKFDRIVPKLQNLKQELFELDKLSVKEILLNKVCETLNFELVRKLSVYEPTVSFFKDIEKNFMHEIVKIISLDRKNCVLFDYFFKESTESFDSSQMSLSQLIGHSSNLTFEKVRQIFMKIESGLIKLVDMDWLSENVYKNNSDQLITESKYLTQYFGIKDQSLRNKQIYLYVQFKRSYAAAIEIDRIRVQLALENKFSELDDILSITKESYLEWDLLKMDSTAERTINVLTRINETEKLKCLTAFAQSLNLVTWLRANTSDLSKLKFLVDLASMSSSNDNSSYDRTLFAKALKEAGNAYASLIYGLTSKVNFFEFMGLCEKVCSHLESDKNIAVKLLEVKDKVELLEEIKRMKGNVELNSLKQAKKINEIGVYQIGLIKEDLKSDFLVNFDKKINLSDIIKVEVDNRQMSYLELKELENILMLIAPKKTGSIDDEESETLEHFIEFFSGVIRLAESYMSLKDHSCPFFDNLIVKIYSNRLKNPTFPSLEILTRSRSLKYTHPDLNSLDTLVKICALINETDEQWSNFVSKKRDSFLSLNFFTLKQLNFLVKAFEIIVRNQSLRKSDFEMVKSILYNLNHGVTIGKIQKSYENNLDFMAEDEGTTECAGEGLDLLFKQEWQEFLSIQNSVNSKQITLTHLALMLQDLSDSSMIVNRTLPGYLTYSDEPNLITCPKNELMSVILSVYALTPDQPVPTNDEVFFCQLETSDEEIESFLRLAFNAPCGKIFTLVNIHNLTYTVSNKIEKFIKNFLNKSSQFNLIFTCDAGKESESILASVYLKNRVRYVLLDHEQNIKSYVNRSLCVRKHELLSHGNFDPTNSTVRVVMSRKSGNGKSTYVKHLIDRVTERYMGSFNYKVIRIKTNTIDLDGEIEKFLAHKKQLDDENSLDRPTIYHIDIAFEVFKNVDSYLFSLVLGSFMRHSNGMVWRRDETKDYFLIEITPPMFKNKQCVHSMIDLLPRIELLTPKQYLYELHNEHSLKLDKRVITLDRIFTDLHRRVDFQRVCFYIRLLNVYRAKTEKYITPGHNSLISQQTVRDEETEKDANRLFNPETDAKMNELECLEILLKVFDDVDPNWHEIRNFIKFSDSQLQIYENSKVLDQIKGLRVFCLSLLFIVAANFGLPSLKCTETEGSEINLDSYTLSEDRKWEKLIYPFMVLNSQGEKATFIGTHCDRATKVFINPNTRQPLTDLTKYYIPRVPHEFFIELLRQGYRMFDNFNELIRDNQFKRLASIMNIDSDQLLECDPDESYELALDNCLKMTAIYLRFVCNIPVVIMGETGCGKTSLIQFFSKLHKHSFERNLIHMKIHGGTTSKEIEEYLNKAEQLARDNFNSINDDSSLKQSPNHLITTILFFDEANTTEDIGLIKEIMCDLTCHGRPVDLSHGLKIIAAVNPYRKHSDEMINKLESAGLGFYISASDTKEKIGHIPMRQLVYRVQPLPTSLAPLVWDFGQLDTNVERTYISQLITSLLSPSQMYGLDKNPDYILILDLLDKSQSFMRHSNDECSFVSIRDIERIIKVTKWFNSLQSLLFPRMTNKKFDHVIDYSYELKLSPLIRSFVLGLIVCYHSALYSNETRRRYRQIIIDTFAQLQDEKIKIQVEHDWVFMEMLKCQNVFFDEIELNKKNIACNLALLENVFMMIVCIELRIPLFIVGKPGSSKSLAKTIVSRAMEGRNSKSELFQNLKETYFVNFQCSPLTTSEMILQAFKEAAKFQESVDTNRSVAVVNLDEIGLAEGSESMPLKVLHPLLESGTDLHDSEAPSTQNKVAVIGISNWALDPAKMNRGLFVSRGEPDIQELMSTTRGICGYDKNILECIEPFIENIARGYLDLCQMARNFKREFFGLRDYYSLIKMIYYFCSRDQVLTWAKLEHAIRRNFGGLEIDNLEPFKRLLYPILGHKTSENDPKCNPMSLVESALKEEYVESNSRYLLFLTENNTAIDIVFNYLTQTVGVAPSNLSVIFGSSFRLDQQYTEVCRNISLIKHSMEIGKTIILLNSYNLYESLYDALNQYYYEFAGQKYVDLGLGTHRIKCSVHENFRLVIIAEREAVYDSKKFPIPLINRLEKHFLNASTILNEDQKITVDDINDWVCKSNLKFVGYHSDAVAGIVLHLSRRNLTREHLTLKAKQLLINCATPDSIVRKKDDFLWNEYFNVQKHLSLKELLDYHLNTVNVIDRSNLIQITSFCKSTVLNLDLKILQNDLGVDQMDVCLLQSFDTQHQFVTKLKQFYSNTSGKSVLLVQADLNSANFDLIACARHHINEIYKKNLVKNFYVCLVVLMEKEVKNFVGFQLNDWSCYHLDEIENHTDDVPELEDLKSKPLSQILEQALEHDFETDDKMDVEEHRIFSLSSLLKKLSHTACSLIIDTNLTRTINRIDLFMKLCDYKPFVHRLVKRLINLQREKESKFMRANFNWLSEILLTKEMNNFSTLRKSSQTYLNTKLSPLLGFIISKIDLYLNLNVLYDSLNENMDWRAGLWLKIFEDESLLKIDYTDMRSVDEVSQQAKELTTFLCQSDFVKKDLYEKGIENLRPSLPFFWLLINQLNSLYNNLPIDSDVSIKIASIPKFFQRNSLYLLLDDLAKAFGDESKFSLQILEYYIRDFLLINCQITNENCLNMLGRGFSLIINDHGHNLENGLAIVHCLFDSIRQKFELFCKFCYFEPRVCSNENFQVYETKEDFLNLDLDAAILCTKILKTNLDIISNVDRVDRVYDLIQLIGELLTKEQRIGDAKRIKKMNIIFEQYQSLIVLRFYSDLIRKFMNDFEDLKDTNPMLLQRILGLFGQQVIELNTVYFNENINFKHKNSIDSLHKFMIKSYFDFKNLVTERELSVIDEYLNNFYVDIIENLCFETKSGRRPDIEMIKTILKVITDKQVVCGDKFYSIKFNYRSLIIQIIFKNYDENVIQHLESWFNVSYVGSDLFRSAEETALLFQNCIIDQYINEYLDYTVSKQLSEANKLCQEIWSERGLLDRFLRDKKSTHKSFDVKNLIRISKLKFCVNIFSRYIHNSDVFDGVKDNLNFIELNQNMKQVIEFSYKDSNSKTITIINYLIKELIRKYGSSSIKYVLSNPVVNWITPKELVGSDDTITDRYVLLGEDYINIKKAILECFSVKSFEPLESLITSENKKDLQVYVCLGLYQNVTLLFKNLTTLTSNIADIFKPLSNTVYQNDKDLIDCLLENKFSNIFKINDDNWKEIDLTLILAHLKYSIQFSNSKIVEPLKSMLTDPKSIKEMYVPTMPQDNLYDIKIALQNNHSGTNKFYACPNGHIYVIGDCGRPWVRSTCKECGEEIGGESHKSVDKNKMVDEEIQDKTLRGYCVQDLSEQTENIRLLNPTSFYYERFIVNALMYLALGDNDENYQHVLNSMSHNEKDPKGFFISQMKHDLKLFARELNLNVDEVFLLLHLSFKNFSTKLTDDSKTWNFNTKSNRQDWEHDFYKHYFKFIVEHSSDKLNESNQKIQEENNKFANSDENQSKLYFMAYELVSFNPENAQYLYENETFWKYRPNVSYELMVKEYNKSSENKQKFGVLSKFNESNNQLKLLVNLSEMMKLVNLLRSKFNKTIFKDKARKTSIESFISTVSLPKEWSNDNIDKCIQAFQNTWCFVQPKIDEYSQHKFDKNTSLSYFLPTFSGDGLLSFVLIHYLSRNQNKMLKQALKKINHIQEKPCYLFDNINYLITFDKNSDLLHIILSNFSYDSKNLKFVFRYESIENQIVDKYLRSKPLIDLTSIQVFEYCDEINNFNIFKRLNEQLKQESLELNKQAEIMDQFKNISELSEALNTLRIMINYAIATSANPNQPIFDFLKKIYTDQLLKQSESSLKTKIMEYCRLKHLKLIWILLMTKRSVLYTLYDQDPFENLDSSFKNELGMKLEFNYDRTHLISMTVLSFQIINFVLSSMKQDDLQSYPTIPIKDMFESLDLLEHIILLDNYRVPDNLEMFKDQEIPIKMNCFYSFWQKMCIEWK